MKTLFKPKLRSMFAIASITLVICVSACKKDRQQFEPTPTSNENTNSAVDTKTIIRFMSITMGVPSNEIRLNEDGNSFFVRGHVFNRAETEKLYLSANVYHATYEK